MNPKEYEDYKLIFENMVEGVALHEMLYDENNNPIDYRITKINKSYEQYTGISSEKAVGKLATELYGTSEAPYIKEYNEVITTNKPFLFETFFPPMKKWFFITVICPKEKQFTTIFQDITSRKNIEESLILKNLVFDNSNAAMMVTDPEFNITEVNNMFIKIGGYDKKEDVISKSVSFFFENVDDAIPVLSSITINGSWEGEVIAKKKDGNTFPVYGIANVLINNKGETIGYQASITDITNRKKMEKDLEQTNLNLKTKLAELEKLNSLMVGRELSMVEMKTRIAKLEKELEEKNTA